ncbi:MAG: DUF354 domain-containing protein [Promethearchaeota archaeon]
MTAWIDACEPKTAVMLRGLAERLVEEAGQDLLVTARDFDATCHLLDAWGVPYHRVGAHGGPTLLGKLRAYAQRLAALVEVVAARDVDFLFCLASPEALRVSFGLQVPNVVFNDEPRSVGVAKLSFPFADHLVVPECIPPEWFVRLGCPEEKLHRFHGIDEVAWLKDFEPDPAVPKALGLEPGGYVVARTEAVTAQYLMDRMKPHETLLVDLLPPLVEAHPELRFLVMPRTPEQAAALEARFADEVAGGRVVLRRRLGDLAHVLYHAALVVTGGGTMVRESALLGVPSVEFFPLDTYPQEQFLADNGFPLVHARALDDAVEACLSHLSGGHRVDAAPLVCRLESPVDVAWEVYRERQS